MQHKKYGGGLTLVIVSPFDLHMSWKFFFYICHGGLFYWKQIYTYILGLLAARSSHIWPIPMTQPWQIWLNDHPNALKTPRYVHNQSTTKSCAYFLWYNSFLFLKRGRYFADYIFMYIFVNEDFGFWKKNHWNLLQLMITQHWFRWWLGSE